MENENLSSFLAFGLALIVLIGVIFGVVTFTFDFVRVNEREVAVITRFGKVTKTVGAGWHYKTPFVSSHSATYDISTQSLTDTMEGTSNDQQIVNFTVNVLYRLDSTKIEQIYKTIGGRGNGGSFGDTQVSDYISPIIQDTVKSVSAEFTAVDQLNKREQLGTRVTDILSTRLADFGVIIETVSLTNISFSEEFNQAIERKVVAQQLAEQKKFELQAEKTQLEVEKVKAQKIAERGKVLKENPDFLEELKINKWDGKLPQFMGSGVDPIIDIRE